MSSFPFPYIVDEFKKQVWIRATYAESKEISLLMSTLYPGYSWYLVPQDMFDGLSESFT